MSELRKDLASGEWIIMAPERARRPHLILPPKRRRIFPPPKDCPFEEENLRKTYQWPPTMSFPSEKKWRAIVIPNKYPAVAHHQACSDLFREGIYPLMGGIGHHDLVVTRDHRKGFETLRHDDALLVFQVFQKRYTMMAHDRCLFYTSAFFNWGPNAGASVPHPHYQMLTLPIVPPEVRASLHGSAEYFRAHRRCVHCDIIRFERKEKRRVVRSDAYSIAITPFASPDPFEVRIFPARHVPSFEKTPMRDLSSIVHTLQFVLKKIRKNLHDPDLNFFIHSAPFDAKTKYRHYHWHIEVRPKITIPAGFELSTGIEINIVDPDQAAAILTK